MSLDLATQLVSCWKTSVQHVVFICSGIKLTREFEILAATCRTLATYRDIYSTRTDLCPSPTYEYTTQRVVASYNSPQLIATNRDIVNGVRENNCKCENIKLVSKAN